MISSVERPKFCMFCGAGNLACSRPSRRLFRVRGALSHFKRRLKAGGSQDWLPHKLSAHSSFCSPQTHLDVGFHESRWASAAHEHSLEGSYGSSPMMGRERIMSSPRWARPQLLPLSRTEAWTRRRWRVTSSTTTQRRPEIAVFQRAGNRCFKSGGCQGHWRSDRVIGSLAAGRACPAPTARCRGRACPARSLEKEIRRSLH